MEIVTLPAASLIAEEAPVGDAEASPASPAPAFGRLTAAPLAAIPGFAEWLVAAWLLGAGALLARSIVSTRRFAADPSAGPALVGVLRPRLVLPADFMTRFDAEERSLIFAHQALHRASGHTVVNGLVEIARCACWFNPLAHLAAARMRMDQELACDAAVIAARPSGRQLKERIALLARPPLSRRRAAAGACAVAAVGVALSYAAWAQQPERQVSRSRARGQPGRRPRTRRRAR